MMQETTHRRQMIVRAHDATAHLENLTRDELLELKLEIDSSLQGIKTQLTQARSAVRESGIYSDRGWYAKATSALRYYQAASQKIQMALRQNREAAKAARAEDPQRYRFVEVFYHVAREQLPKALFAALKETAAQRYAMTVSEEET